MKKTTLIWIRFLVVVSIAVSGGVRFSALGQDVSEPVAPQSQRNADSGQVQVSADHLSPIPAPPSLAQDGPRLGFEEAIQRAEQVAPLFVDLYASLDRSQFDLDDLNASLDYDATQIVDFVRSEIAFEQYAGVLRGELGTLIGRAGNAVDQALLIRRLLDDAGFETRLVRGTLSTDQATVLINQMAAPRSSAESPIEQAVLADLLNRHLQVDMAQIVDPTLDATDVYKTVTGSDAQLIFDALAAAGVTLGDNSVMAELVSEAQDYFWVQYRLSAFDPWTDAHPAFTDAAAPVEIAVEEVYREALPRNLYHRFRLEIFIEQKQFGELIVHPILTGWERTAAELVGAPITFQNQPNNVDFESVTDIDTMLADASLFLPFVNGELLSRGFDLDGHPFSIDMISLDTLGVTSLFQTVGGALEGVTGALDDLGGTPSGNPDDLITLTAQWIEYTLIAPDGHESTTRRYIMDRIGAENREQGSQSILDDDVLEASKALLTTHTIVVMPTQYGSGYRAERMMERLVKEMDFLSYLASATDLNYTLLGHSMSELVPVHDIFYAAALDFARSTETNLVSYLPEPMLLVHQEGLVPCRPDETGFERVDIINNTRRVFSTADGRIQPAPADAIRQGVWETYAERMLIRNSSIESFNTFNALREAATNSIPLLVLTPEESGQVDAMSYSERTRHAVLNDLLSGYVVIIPERATEDSGLTGWWRVHPETGETLGLASEGYGQALVEYVSSFLNLTFALAGYNNCVSGGGAAGCCLAAMYGGLALGFVGGTVYSVGSAVADLLVWDVAFNVAGYSVNLC